MDETNRDKDMNRTFSEKLFAILSNIGFTSEFRRWSLEVADTQKILDYVDTVGENKQVNNVVHLGVGSRVDGTFRASLNSDIDCLYVIQALSVGEDVQSDVAYFIVSDEDTHPGYVKLEGNRHAKSKQENKFFKEDNDGYLTHHPKYTHPARGQSNLEKSGPAFTSTSAFFSMDHVYALQSLSWPQIAQEWLQRPRYYEWPSKDSIEALRKEGCLIVPTGHPLSKGTKRHDLEWRLSFTLQETHLMGNLNDVQYKCYVLLKMIKEDIVTFFMGKSLSSYHCKTSLFYTIEKNEPGIWSRENLTECVCKCLRQLLEWAENEFCPNYFLPQSNLFHGKIDSEDMPKLVEILRKTLSNFCKSLKSIECERLGEWIRCINSNEYDPDIETNLQNSANESLLKAVSRQITDVANLVNTRFRECLQFSLMCGAVDGHLQSLQLLYSQYDQKDLNLESLTPAIAYLHSSLASHLASLSIHAPPAVKDWYVCASALHFMQAKKHEPIVCRLKLASVLHMTGHNDSAKTILKDMRKDIEAVEIFSGVEPLMISSRCYDNNSLKHILQKPVSQVLKTFSAGPVIFLPAEMDMTPHALQYEMFRSVATPRLDNCSPLHFYYDWAVATADIFYHFLCFQTGIYNGYDQFTENCKFCDLRQHYHYETRLNIIGWVAKQSKCFHSAALMFLQSWREHCRLMEPTKRLLVVDDNQFLHNAAKLHMLVLLNDIREKRYNLENEDAAAWRYFRYLVSMNHEILENPRLHLDKRPNSSP